METQDYIQKIKNIPIPSDEQIEKFCDHFSGAHSWYKHFSLLRGAQCVFYLGEFKSHEQQYKDSAVHITEKEIIAHDARLNKYLQRCGHIKYYIRSDSVKHDSTPAPDEVCKLTEITLYPYVASDINALSAVMWQRHKESLKRIKNGYPHPHRESILEWEVKLKSFGKDFSRLDDLYEVYDRLMRTQQLAIKQSLMMLTHWIGNQRNHN